MGCQKFSMEGQIIQCSKRQTISLPHYAACVHVLGLSILDCTVGHSYTYLS
jgi:hypothetical protein